MFSFNPRHSRGRSSFRAIPIRLVDWKACRQLPTPRDWITLTERPWSGLFKVVFEYASHHGNVTTTVLKSPLAEALAAVNSRSRLLHRTIAISPGAHHLC